MESAIPSRTKRRLLVLALLAGYVVWLAGWLSGHTEATIAGLVLLGTLAEAVRRAARRVQDPGSESWRLSYRLVEALALTSLLLLVVYGRDGVPFRPAAVVIATLAFATLLAHPCVVAWRWTNGD